MTDHVLSQRADILLADLTSNGGLLNAEQANTFIRKVEDAPTVLGQMRVIPMSGPKLELSKIGIGQRMFHKARRAGGANDNGTNDRYLAKNKRTKPTTGKVVLETAEVQAEVRIGYEILEDNIERGNMAETLLALIATRGARDFEELALLSDTASTDEDLAQFDGILKRANLNIYDHNDAAVSVEAFAGMQKALPTRYRRSLPDMRYFVPSDLEVDYRVAVSNRNTGLGDATLVGGKPVPVLGVPMVGAALMPAKTAILTDPNNLLFGIQRNIRIEQDRDIRASEVIIVVTARIAVAIEEIEGVAKGIAIGL